MQSLINFWSSMILDKNNFVPRRQWPAPSWWLSWRKCAWSSSTRPWAPWRSCHGQSRESGQSRPRKWLCCQTLWWARSGTLRCYHLRHKTCANGQHYTPNDFSSKKITTGHLMKICIQPAQQTSQGILWMPKRRWLRELMDSYARALR